MSAAPETAAPADVPTPDPLHDRLLVIRERLAEGAYDAAEELRDHHGSCATAHALVGLLGALGTFIDGVVAGDFDELG